MKALMATLLLAVVACAGCAGGSTMPSTSTTAKAYTCSMCGGSFDKPGSCPKCGMALTEK